MKCRDQKRSLIAEDEMNEFNQAYDHALESYRKILAETELE